MAVLITFMFGIGAILPLVGFFRLARRTYKDKIAAEAKAEERGFDEMTYEDFESPAASITHAPAQAWRQLHWDVGLVGGGVFLSGIASILSIWSLS